MPENKDILLYLLSTIPQTLGAMLAIVGAFHLSFIKDMRADMIGQSQLFMGYLNTSYKLKNIAKKVNPKFDDKSPAIIIIRNLLTVIKQAHGSQQYKQLAIQSSVLAGYLQENKDKDVHHSVLFLISDIERVTSIYTSIREQSKRFSQLLIETGIILIIFIIEFLFVRTYTSWKLLYNYALILNVILGCYGLIKVVSFIYNAVKNNENN